MLQKEKLHLKMVERGLEFDIPIKNYLDFVKIMFGAKSYSFTFTYIES